MLLEVFHEVVDLGGIKLLAFEVVFEDLVFLFHLVEFGDKLEDLVFGCTVFFDQEGNIPPEIFEEVVFVVSFFFNDLVVPIQQVILVVSFFEPEPDHVEVLFHLVGLGFPVVGLVSALFDDCLPHGQLVFKLLDSEGELLVLLLGLHFEQVLGVPLLLESLVLDQQRVLPGLDVE